MIIALVGTVITVVAFLFSDLGRRLIVSITPGARYNWEVIPKKITHARHQVEIMQTWLPGLRKEIPLWKEALAHQGTLFKVLLLDQKLIPFRLRCREDRKTSELDQNVSELVELAEHLNERSRFEVRFYSCLPFGPIYAVDEDIYWGIYLADRDALEGPVHHCKRNSRLGHLIMNSFEVVWESARESSGSLSLSQVNRHRTRAHAAEEADIRRESGRLGELFHVNRLDHIAQAEPERGLLCILRHADTDLDAVGMIAGELDVGINASGRERARDAGKDLRRFRWDRIYSSPLRRCIETLSESLGNTYSEIQFHDELRARAMGDAEGFLKREYSSSLAQYHGMDILGAFHVAANGGESYCDVFWRVIPLMEEIAGQIHAGQHVLVCSHEAPIRIMLMVLKGLDNQSAFLENISGATPYHFVVSSSPLAP